MPTVYGLHEIELQPGVEPDEYERFFAEEIAPSPMLPGWRVHLLKGDLGRTRRKVSRAPRNRESGGTRSVLPQSGRGVGRVHSVL
jgi:hypothetical protein